MSFTLYVFVFTHLFQEIVVDVTTNWVALKVEVDVHVLAEPTGVVIAVCLGITESLEDTVGLQQNALDPEKYK